MRNYLVYLILWLCIRRGLVGFKLGSCLGAGMHHHEDDGNEML